MHDLPYAIPLNQLSQPAAFCKIRYNRVGYRGTRQTKQQQQRQQNKQPNHTKRTNKQTKTKQFSLEANISFLTGYKDGISKFAIS